MILVEPEKRVADQEIAHFVAAKIKNQRAPILMLALARVHVFVKVGPIEFGERVRIFREMRRHPIHDHADAGLVACVDEVAKFIGGAKTAGGRVVVCNLITPRAFERVFGNRQQLDVGITHFKHVGQQCLGELEITQMPVSFISTTTP